MPSIAHALKLALISVFLLGSCRKAAQSPGEGSNHSAASPSAPAKVQSVAHGPSVAFVSGEQFVAKYLRTTEPGGRKKLDAEFIKAGGYEKLDAGEIGKLLESFDLEKDFNDPVVSSAMRQLAKKDVNRFFATLAKYGAPNWLGQNVDIARVLFHTDPDAAKKWFNTTPIENRGAKEYPMVNALSAAMADGNISKQADLLAARPNQPDCVLYDTYASWGQKDPEAAAAHAAKLPEGKGRDHAIFTVLYAAAFTDPLRGYNLAMDIGYPLDDRNLGGLFEKIAKVSPGDAVLILQDTPAERVSAALSVPGALERVAAQDPNAAVQAVSKLVFTRTNEPLYSRMVDTLAKQDPGLGREWVKGLPDGEWKERAMERLSNGAPGGK